MSHSIVLVLNEKPFGFWGDYMPTPSRMNIYLVSLTVNSMEDKQYNNATDFKRNYPFVVCYEIHKEKLSQLQINRYDYSPLFWVHKSESRD